MTKRRPKKMTETEKGLLSLSDRASLMQRGIDILIERNERALAAADELLRSPRSRPPFVCCLLEGTGETGPTSLAQAGEVANGMHTFEFRSNFRVFGGRLIVFCDVSRVRVRIFCGTNLLHASLDGAPIAYVPLLEVGVLLRVQCEVLT